MTVPETKQRPPMLVWVAAAAAVVLLVGLPLFLFRGGGEPAGPATTIAAGDTTTTTVDEPTTTMAPSTTTVPAATFDVSYVLYLFSDEITTALGDPALVPVLRTETLDSDLDATLRAALAVDRLRELPEPFNLPPGFATAIPDQAAWRDFQVSDGVATIDFPAEFESGGGSMAMITRLAQVVFTATQFPDVDSVLFKIDGEVVDVFSGEGILLDGPQTREDYVDILPQIFLDEPAIGSRVSSPFGMNGIANVFEATVQFEIVDESGTVIQKGFTTATCGTGCWGEFAAQAPFYVPEEMPGEIVVYEEAALDGSRVNELRYPVTLLPGGEPPATTTTEAPTQTSLPGEAFDIGPAAGDVIAVVGVAHDDVLNVREFPGADFAIVTTLDPLADNIVATGRHRLLESSIWTEVIADGPRLSGVIGWVNSRYIGYLGGVDDLTSSVVSQMGGIPEAETMLDLGTTVADSFRVDEGGFRAEMVIPPAVSDLGEVTFDVVGLLDDAQLGWRLHIFGQPTAGGEGFSLMSVEATALCGRGVTAEGFCI